MRKNINMYFQIALLLYINLFLLCGCHAESSEEILRETEGTLWIVTEQTVSDGMNGTLAKIAEEFQKDYPNVSLTIDILPTQEEARTNHLAHLRSQMDAGSGPDLFLMPTYPILTLEQPIKYTYMQVQPLFSNVEQAMAEGYFLDIASLYKNDHSLEKSGLNQAVMDVGAVGKARYVLPLRYDMLMLYTTEEALQQYSLDISALDQPFDKWMQSAIATGKKELACGADCLSLFVFSDMINYQNETVMLQEETVQNYLTLYRQIQSLIEGEIDHRYKPTLETYAVGFYKQYPVQIGKLSQSLEFAAIAKQEQQTLQMIPLRTVQGDIQATVSYYGALGKDCTNPELAYNFLRRFLLEDAQWEKYRQRFGSNQLSGLLEQSYPVRTEGSVEPLWENLKLQIADLSGSSDIRTRQEVGAIKEALLAQSIIQADIPTLEEKINKVTFFYHLPTRFDDILFQATTADELSLLSAEVIESLHTYLPRK